jgi:hypothetical protein
MSWRISRQSPFTWYVYLFTHQPPGEGASFSGYKDRLFADFFAIGWRLIIERGFF